MTPLSHIRNFALIAHVDHGKSTLADRLIQRCGTVEERRMRDQILDSMDIERERGITIKAQTVCLPWRAKDGTHMVLNLVDTPGHVDFSYEVSRSLAACEGSLLLVDCAQGIEAQTLANAWNAVEHDHEIIPVLNKIDLAAADPKKTADEISQALGLDPASAIPVSAKTGQNIDAILRAIEERLPPPKGIDTAPLSALLIDSWYDSYLGVIVLVRVRDGFIRKGMTLRMMSVDKKVKAEMVGVFTPAKREQDALGPGEIGFVSVGVKDIADCRVGDTLTDDHRPVAVPLAGFSPRLPSVFCGFFPHDGQDFDHMRDAFDKLALNDSSFSREPEHSTALGHGFRCGFHGLLHLEVVYERLKREFGLDPVMSAPSVTYRFRQTDGRILETGNPAKMPEQTKIAQMEEPWIEASIITPGDYLGSVMDLCSKRRGVHKSLEWAGERAIVTALLPLSEVVFDFTDSLKSLSRGYASFNYRDGDWKEAKLVKVDILINGEKVDAFSFIADGVRAERRGRHLCERLKELIPRQLFKVPIQASIGSRIIARETVAAMRKDVTAKCYGGDISRKRKLLDKQKAGKKKMQMVGKVAIPQTAIIQALRTRDE